MAAKGGQKKNFPPRSPPLEVKPFYPPGGLKNHSPPG